MEFWRKVHWFFTSQCNERCKFCFKPDFSSGSANTTKTLTNILVNNEVRKVIFTGGEPLLSKDLDASLDILHRNRVYTSVHTNATLLTNDRIRDLAALADEIAIPIDSIDRATQEYLRNTDCLPQIKAALGQLRDTNVRIGIHTVATSANIEELPKIYNFLRKGRFDYWRIYELNSNLVSDKFKSVDRFREVEELKGEGATAYDGGVNCLFADFLLMEERIAKHMDKRVQFVGVSDYDREPYFFLDPRGNVYLATWFSQARRKIGNLLTEGFRQIKRKAIKEDSKGALYDEEAFIETEQNQPLWVRAAWEGNYFPEELEEDLRPKYYRRFKHLSELHLARLIRQEAAPKNAQLNYI